METYRGLQCQLWLAQPLDVIWDFHKDPSNLLKISPEFLKLSLQDVPATIGKGASFKITSHNKFVGPFFKWVVEYSDWGEEENYKFFVDIQKGGPFQVWKHKHEFRSALDSLEVGGRTYHPKNAGTWILDTLEYSLKPQFKKFEWVAEKMLTQLFIFRKRRLEKEFC